MLHETTGSARPTAVSDAAQASPAEVAAALAADGAAVFLDFDGVLVHLAETPDAIEIAPALPGILARLHGAAGGALALVSGRAAETLRGFLPGFPGVIAGSHGAEIDRGEGVRRVVSPDPERVAAIQGLVAGVAAADPPLLAEPKPMGAVLHYRRRPEAGPEARRALEAAMAGMEGFHIHDAKMAFEIRPDGVGKETAVRALMAEPPFAGRRPAYFGDDATDEPALAWVRAQGGLSVKVGEGPSAAAHRLSGPEEVHDALKRLASGGAR